MNDKTKQWLNKLFLVGLLVTLTPCSTAWATQDRIPTKEYRSRLIDCHRLGTEVVIGIPHGSFKKKLGFGWGLGAFYGYAWVQRSDLWFIPEVGLKYRLKQSPIAHYPGNATIKEHCLNIPLSINMVAITSAWEEDKVLFSKFTLGLGYEVVVALSSSYLQKGQADLNLLQDIPGLSRFSGNVFLASRATTCWGVYLGLMLKLSTELLVTARGDGQRPSGQVVSKGDVRDFRADATSAIEISLGLDILQLLED